MKTVPKISEMEWEVMRVVWAEAPCPAWRVIQELMKKDATWHPKTIKTYLNRLVKKNALAFRKEGRAYLYRPQVTERACISLASESFLDRVFGGSLKPMLAHFVEHKKLSPQEIRELKQLLERGE